MKLPWTANPTLFRLDEWDLRFYVCVPSSNSTLKVLRMPISSEISSVIFHNCVLFPLFSLY